jgi:hypothetical protein
MFGMTSRMRATSMLFVPIAYQRMGRLTKGTSRGKSA